jgi:hypothetical protein
MGGSHPGYDLMRMQVQVKRIHSLFWQCSCCSSCYGAEGEERREGEADDEILRLLISSWATTERKK